MLRLPRRNSLPEVGDAVTEARLAEARPPGQTRCGCMPQLPLYIPELSGKSGVRDVDVENYSTYIAPPWAYHRADSMK